MRKLPIAISFLVGVALSFGAAAATPPPAFAGTWIVSQGGMMADGTPIPFEVFSVPEFLHIDPGNEIRAISGMFHPSGLGTVWTIVPGRELTMTVNSSMGIGDWMRGSQGEVLFSYHAFLYDASNKPIGYLHVVRTLDGPVAGEPGGPDIPPDSVGPGTGMAVMAAPDDVISGMAFIRFFDLGGQPLALPMGPGGALMFGLAGPYRAVRAATANLPQ